MSELYDERVEGREEPGAAGESCAVSGPGAPPCPVGRIGASRFLEKTCAILRHCTGHDFRSYKTSTLVRRVRRRMAEAGSPSIYDYAATLSQDAAEAERLFRDLLISVTHFFRAPEAFELLAAKVVPRLFEGKDAGGFVRVWVPGARSSCR